MAESESQNEQLPALKEKLEDIETPFKTDFALIKFLKDGEGDVKRAAKAFRRAVAWRQENGLDTILEDYEPPAVLSRFYPGGFQGYAKDGTLVSITMDGQISQDTLLECFGEEECTRFVLHGFQEEWIDLQNEYNKTGLTKGFTYIEDFSGLTLAQVRGAGAQWFDKVARCEEHFPGLSHKIFVVNPPGELIMNVIWASYTKELKDMTTVIPADETLSTLSKYIDEASIPTIYGGTSDSVSTIGYTGAIPDHIQVECKCRLALKRAAAAGTPMTIKVPARSTELFRLRLNGGEKVEWNLTEAGGSTTTVGVVFYPETLTLDANPVQIKSYGDEDVVMPTTTTTQLQGEFICPEGPKRAEVEAAEKAEAEKYAAERAAAVAAAEAEGKVLEDEESDSDDDYEEDYTSGVLEFKFDNSASMFGGRTFTGDLVLTTPPAAESKAE